MKCRRPVLGFAWDSRRDIKAMYCVVKNCKSYWTPNSKIKFHSFPKDAKRRNTWLSIIRIKGKFYLSAKICSLHFKPNDYDPKRPGRLLNNAAPSRLPHSCDSVSTLTEACNVKPSTSTEHRSESVNTLVNTTFIQILQHESKEYILSSIEPSTSSQPNISSASVDTDTKCIDILQPETKGNLLFTALTSPRAISSYKAFKPGSSQLNIKVDLDAKDEPPTKRPGLKDIYVQVKVKSPREMSIKKEKERVKSSSKKSHDYSRK